jgi:hypothetical protein
MANQVFVRRTRRMRRAGLALSGAGVALAWLMAAPVQAAPVDGSRPASVTVGDAAEAWYAAAPVDLCTTPIGCPPPEAPSSPYPADTLHVGVAGGQESARTYLLPDLTGLPYGATVTDGTMTLPLAAAPGDGTQAPDSARIVACLATQPVADGTQGSTAAPPKTDCGTSVPLEYDADGAAFTLDLTPFLAAWRSALPYGLALVPDPDKTAVTDAWHVTFNGRERADVDHITSVVVYQPPVTPPATTTGGSDTEVPAGPTTGTVPPADVPPADLPEQPAIGGAVADPPQVAPPAAAPVTQPVAFAHEFQYPMAFLLPLALLAGAVFFGRLFTRDATPLPSNARAAR